MSPRLTLSAPGMAKRSVITRNASWVVVQVLTSTAVLFGTYFVLVRTVGIDQIGLLALISTLSLAARVSELGLTGAITRFVPEYLAVGRRDQAAETIITSATILAFVTAAGALMAGFALYTSVSLFVEINLMNEARALLLPTLFSLWLNLVANCIVMSLDGIHRADKRAQIAVVASIVFGVAVTLLVQQIGVFSVPVAQTLQACVTLLLALSILKSELPEIISARPSVSCLKRIWSVGAQIQAITLLVLAYDPLTKLLVNHYGGLTAVGMFDLANRIINQIRSVIVGANQVMVPHYAMLNKADPARLIKTVSLNSRLLIAAASVAFSISGSFLPLISKLWLGHISIEFMRAALILMTGSFAACLNTAVYFVNLGGRSISSNVLCWTIIIISNLIGGLIFGELFSVIGVFISISVSLMLGTFVLIHAYLRSTKQSWSSLADPRSLKFLAWGGTAFSIAPASLIIGHLIPNEILEGAISCISALSLWAAAALMDMRARGETAHVWFHGIIASFRG